MSLFKLDLVLEVSSDGGARETDQVIVISIFVEDFPGFTSPGLRVVELVGGTGHAFHSGCVEQRSRVGALDTGNSVIERFILGTVLNKAGISKVA